jgi:hypothetical protein
MVAKEAGTIDDFLSLIIISLMISAFFMLLVVFFRWQV